MICIVDYGVGNIQEFLNLFKSIGIDAKRAKVNDDFLGADRLILPGVGSFDHAMNQLNNSGMRSKLEELVLGRMIPIMGVCVGMQMLAIGSEEGILPGLNWIPGKVRAFSTNSLSSHLPMPHMGWNDLQINTKNILFSRGFENNPKFYFLHSYYFDAIDKLDVAATATYGFNFDAVISRSNIHGLQCHPEKSHNTGLQILKNFVEL